MFTFILKMVISFASSEIGREAIKLGAEKLVKSTDNGIDDEIVGIFLDEAVTSKRNKLTEVVVKKITSKL